MNHTTATVLSWADPALGTPIEPHVVARAVDIFHQTPALTRYYHDCEVEETDTGEPILLPLDSERGSELLVDELERTRNQRSRLLRDFEALLDEADSRDDAAVDEEVADAARKLGSQAHSETTHLFDATDYTNGSPILSHDRFEEIIDYYDSETLHLVPVKLTH